MTELSPKEFDELLERLTSDQPDNPNMKKLSKELKKEKRNSSTLSTLSLDQQRVTRSANLAPEQKENTESQPSTSKKTTKTKTHTLTYHSQNDTPPQPSEVFVCKY